MRRKESGGVVAVERCEPRARRARGFLSPEIEEFRLLTRTRSVLVMLQESKILAASRSFAPAMWLDSIGIQLPAGLRPAMEEIFAPNAGPELPRAVRIARDRRSSDS